MSNPFVAGTSDSATTTDNSKLPTYTEYAWDFANDRFMYNMGQHKIVTENEALKVWIYKTLKTERWRYLAYDNAYGIELEKFIGTHTNNSDSAGEIEQYIKEALLINPYIKSIDKIQAGINNDELSYDIYLTTIYGALNVKSANY
ncbi:DUF2634 domain-containing protein [Pectinatus frisingensis]|uniref:DUF2634 domain-containing protein n=1 Tax=Pectinatus frisingensis TaxID=865 RepID=UPI0018C7CFFA|nr:DUF2634 domain-containing protein [Pectinatus frisingensis]